MPTPLNELVAMLLKPHLKSREDMAVLEQLLGIHPMQKAVNQMVSGPLGQLAQRLQAQKQQADARKQWYGKPEPSPPPVLPEAVRR